MERLGDAFSTSKEKSCPCCFFPRRVPGWDGGGVGRGVLASPRVAEEDGVSWCWGFGSGFARLGCSEAAAPAGGCRSGLCKFILLGFAIMEDPATKIAPSSLSCMGFSQWARHAPGVQLQGGLMGLFQLHCFVQHLARRSSHPSWGSRGCCKNILSDCADFRNQTLPTCF